MALSKMDEKAALVVIDLQKGIVNLPTVQPMSEIVGRATQLARAFRERALPVVLVNVTGRPGGRTQVGAARNALPSDWAELLPELEQSTGDLVVTKQCPGAFTGTTLQQQMRERGVTQIFLVGVATSSGVEATARTAYDLGYDVVLVVDAMTDRDADAQRNSVEKIFPKLGEIETTDNVLKAMAR